MSDFPECSRRGRIIDTNTCECFSNKIIHPREGYANIDTCKICPYKNEEDDEVSGGNSEDDEGDEDDEEEADPQQGHPFFLPPIINLSIIHDQYHSLAQQNQKQPVFH